MTQPPGRALGRVGEQTRIGGDKVGDGSSAKTCDWCGEKAVKRIELKRKIKGAKAGATTGSGVFLAACGQHIDVLNRTTANPLPAS